MQSGWKGVVEGCNLGKWRGAPLVILYVRRTDRPTEAVPWLRSNLHSYWLTPSGKTSSNSADTGTDCTI